MKNYILKDYDGYVYTIEKSKKDCLKRINEKLKNGGRKPFRTLKEMDEHGFYILTQ